ncbi:MAG: tripartite tricarboxylate transporter substrate binding protein [Pseudolabrys sp.]|nr:tripartite tricarboxylate transporter substrate binding protein [Pseudolabrys sp.]MBV9955811.1 tripartite tricarboxylate transporter substrate binding protein [Pseudolabrys sp.]
MRRILSGVVASLALCALTVAVQAQSFPSKPITLIVPFPAGSTTDLVGRIMAQDLSKTIGQTVVIDNRGGAGGTVGTEAVARAAPDGYTILMGTIGTHSINPAVYPKINYDPVADFAPVIQYGTAPNVLVVNPDVPVKTLNELAQYLRERPGKVNYGSSGNGTSNHLSGAMFASRQKVSAVHIPYKGGAQAITDLLRGEISFMFYHYLPLLPHIAEGKLRALAITSAGRIDALPNIPTMKEAGMDDFEVSAWFGVYAPAKTPPEIVKALHDAIAKGINSPETKKNLQVQGVDPVNGSSEDLAKLTKSEIARWSVVVEQAGAKLAN